MLFPQGGTASAAQVSIEGRGADLALLQRLHGLDELLQRRLDLGPLTLRAERLLDEDPCAACQCQCVELQLCILIVFRTSFYWPLSTQSRHSSPEPQRQQSHGKRTFLSPGRVHPPHPRRRVKRSAADLSLPRAACVRNARPNGRVRPAFRADGTLRRPR